MSLAELLDAVARPFCHQLTERVIHVDDTATALCARCTGFHLTFALGLVLAWGRFTSLDARRLALAALAVSVTAVDALCRDGGEVERYLTGAVGGAGLALAAGSSWLADPSRAGARATSLCLVGGPLVAALLYLTRAWVGVLPLSVGGVAGLLALLIVLVGQTPKVVLGPFVSGRRDS